MKNKDLAVNLSKSKCDFVIGPNENPDLNEAEDKYSKWLFSGNSGGTIIFSTDVNSKTLSDNKFKNQIIKKFKTIKNRTITSKILDKIRRKNNKDMLFKLAEEIRDTFDQVSVLVQVAETKQIYFVN